MEHFQSHILFFLVIALISIGSCNQNFQPLEENSTSPFSLFGFLDASVDTQRVRVSPLRKQIDSFTEMPEMTVTLENLETGKTAVMKDSLYQIFFPSGINAPTAWTTMKLDYGQTYRLKAERPDGAASSVPVTIPDDFPTPRLEVSGDVIDRLFINGAEQLVDVQSRWFYRIIIGGQRIGIVVKIPYRGQVEKRGTGAFSLRINTILERRRVIEQFPSVTSAELIGRQIFVAVAGPDWDESIISFDDLSYALPDIASNVENGVGYLIGIVSKSIPYKSCFDDNEDIISCPAEQPIFN